MKRRDVQRPLHGGNANMIGWQLMGYPGPVMNYREEIDKSHGEAWRRKPVSLAEIVGYSVAGWEPEKGVSRMPACAGEGSCATEPIRL